MRWLIGDLSKRAVLAAIELREHYNLKETFAADLL
jgi:hypothetical protein